MNKYEKNKFQVAKVVSHAKIPEKAHLGDLGWDLFSAESYAIHPNDSELVSTGIRLKFPHGIGGLAKDRSSISTKYNVYVHAGVMDAGYRGEIGILMHNHGDKIFHIDRGDKIAQLVLVAVINNATGLVEVSEFDDDTSRGTKGFGSSGK